MDKLKIGIVGCGAIGSSLAKVIVKDLSDKAQLCSLYDIDILRSRNLSMGLKSTSLVADNLKYLIKKSDLIIEAASAKSSFDIARSALKLKKDVMVMSVGGIVSGFDFLRNLAFKNKRKLYIPTGAISGIDALKAARLSKINSVTLTTTKNPLSFKGVEYIKQKHIKIDKIKGDKVLFYGRAIDAVKYFPQNINVAAVLSLAGIGPKKTYVKIIASSKTSKNIHEIEVKSSSARITTRTENELHPDNPKTSYLAVLSAAATLRKILEPVVIGT